MSGALFSRHGGGGIRGTGLFLVLLISSVTAYAHGVEPLPEQVDVWRLWSWEPGVIGGLGSAAILYTLGFIRLPRPSARILRPEACFFFSGWILLVLALVSPIHRWGGWLFSVHMVQHELLMIGAAPLLVLGRPGLIILRVLSSRDARRLTGWVDRVGGTTVWHFLVNPWVAWLVQAAALWSWHIPSLFQAALKDESVHALQHLCFFVTALWFWSSVFRGPRRVGSYGVAVLNLFTTGVHSSVLGALITFAPHVWYSAYVKSTYAWGLTPLQDQQLGGLIMWVPAGLVYIVAALILFAAWLRQGHRPQGWSPASVGFSAREKEPV